MLREQGRRTIRSNQIIFGIGSNNNNWGRIRLRDSAMIELQPYYRYLPPVVMTKTRDSVGRSIELSDDS